MRILTKALRLFSFIQKGNARSVKVKKNILAILFIKGISIIINLLIVPLTISYVDTETYGIWLTLSSVVAWISFFDVGLNKGLKNRFAEARALNDVKLAKSYVSTTYAMLTCIFIPFFLLFLLINSFISWGELFNLQTINSEELSTVMIIIVGYFSIKFIISTINVILTADQKPAAASLRVLLENISSLVVILILKQMTQGSLENLCLAICITPLFVIITYSVVLFNSKYKDVKPSINCVNFKLLPNLFSLGLKFFVIQIAGLIQYQTTNFIIMREWGGIDVTNYNIAYKYFSVLSMLMMILLTPIWSATTEAYVKRDYLWIKNIVNKYNKLFILFIFVGISLLLISTHVYEFWLGENVVDIPFVLSFWVLINVLVMMFGSIYVNILNGIGALKIQFYSSLIAPFFFILLVYLFVSILNLEVYSIIIASIIANFNGLIIAPIQYRNIFYKNKKGVWIA